MKESLVIRNFGPLNDVTIPEIKPFSFFIGTSGSGKSTILKIVSYMRWIYKMMGIRSYLYYSGVKSIKFKLDFKKNLKSMGLDKFLKPNSYMEYTNGSFSLIYNGKMKALPKYIPKEELSLEKICFISDKRNIIGDVLENNVTIKKRAYYVSETFEDFIEASKTMQSYDMPSLGVRLQLKKTNNGTKHFIEPISGTSYSINLNEASSGTQSSMPMAIIVEYFCRHYDIVSALNQSIFSFATKSDSLKDFRATTNIGELPYRRVSISIEEPEISLYPSTQCALIDRLVCDCNSTEGYNVGLMIATHSPYIINHLNVLLRREGKASIDASDLGVYNVAFGKIQMLLGKDIDTGEWVVDTQDLSEAMMDIYNEYQSLAK